MSWEACLKILCRVILVFGDLFGYPRVAGKSWYILCSQFANAMLGLYMNSSLDSGDIEWRLILLNTCIQSQGLVQIGVSITLFVISGWCPLLSAVQLVCTRIVTILGWDQGNQSHVTNVFAATYTLKICYGC